MIDFIIWFVLAFAAHEVIQLFLDHRRMKKRDEFMTKRHARIGFIITLERFGIIDDAVHFHTLFNVRDMNRMFGDKRKR